MNLFIFGAGFTKAIFAEVPLNDELVDVLKSRYGTSALRRLPEHCTSTNIELALTKLDAEIAAHGSDELVALRRQIELELTHFFSAYRASPELLTAKPWLGELARGVIAPGDVAVSLNYDCVLEGVLDLAEKWSPNLGYGENLSFRYEQRYPPSPVEVLKLHGSVSFVSADYIDKPTSEAIGFIFDESIFPRSAKNKHHGYGAGTGRPAIVAPSYVKTLPLDLTYLALDALNAVERADRLVVVGCSLRPEDSILRLR